MAQVAVGGPRTHEQRWVPVKSRTASGLQLLGLLLLTCAAVSLFLAAGVVAALMQFAGPGR